MTHREHVNLFFATQLWLHNRKGSATQRYSQAMRNHDIETMESLTPELLELHGRELQNNRDARRYRQNLK